MQKTFVLSHASDIDGVGSAALIRMKYGVPTSRLFFSDYSKEGISYAGKKLAPFYGEGITLFIADLGVNDLLIGSYRAIIDSIRKGGGKVFWFDHHPWTQKGIDELASKCDIAVVGENARYCATEITYKRLGIGGAFAKRFVDIVHYSDFNIRPESREIRKMVGFYALSITSYNMNRSREYITRRLRHIAKVISGGSLIDRRTKDDAIRFGKTNEKRIGRMLDGMEVRKGFALGFSKAVQSTGGCMAIIERSGRPIGIYVNVKNGIAHIRSLKADITPLSRSLGGGGHPRASGFYIDPKKFWYFRSKSGRVALADYLEKRMAKLGLNG
ncbi:MAG: hypothetical protein ACYCO0_01455 [Candidatus Micrarchaeaceae archaeon]